MDEPNAASPRRGARPGPTGQRDRPIPRRIRRGEQGYPAGLLGLEPPPEGLWVLGQGDPDRCWVAVVGARQADWLGELAAEEIARQLASHGLGVLSGGAMGVDAAAHQAALQAGGMTAAVMAGGVDVATPPRNRGLFAAMLGAGGLLVGEHPPGTRPFPRLFARRNALIAAMARAVIVVQAGAQSGSLITAHWAKELRRPVLVVPGGWNDRARDGCMLLLRQGALPCSSTDELELLLHGLGLARQPPAPSQQGGGEPCPAVCQPDAADPGDPVLAALGAGPATLEVIASRSGLAPAPLLARLTELELAGRLRAVPGGVYVRLGR